MKKILLTNDDGIDAPGILALADALKSEYEVYVVAPSIQNSGMSHAVTYFKKDLTVKEVKKKGFTAYAVSGTPADCVYAFLYGICEEPIDLVISGINDGPNYATDIAYSGTIGAAEEAHIAHLPSMAVSLERPSTHYETAVEVTKKLIPLYLGNSECRKYICSVNVPDLGLDELKGYRLTTMDNPILYERRLLRKELGNGEFALHCPEGLGKANPKGENQYDVSAVYNGYVSITPLDINTVNHEVMNILATVFKPILR